MRKIIMALAILAPIAANAATNAPSECKGLTQDACGAKSGICSWINAIKAGDTSPKTGKTYKVTRTAYCRKKPGSVPAQTK